MALRARGLARRVIGLGRNAKRIDDARLAGCLDESTTDSKTALAESGLVVLCQPVRTIIDFLPECFSLIPARAVVTDVGSTKNTIVQAGEAAAARRGEGTAFIGSHPMAGSERTGAANAIADLYEGATCHVTITPQTPPFAAARVVQLWQRLGMKIVLDHPERHDRLVAAISHVPHVMAVALVQSLEALDGHPQFLARLLGPGFRDMTRVAMGSPEMWTDIVRENREAVLWAANGLSVVCDEWSERIRRGDDAEILALFERIREFRRALDPSICTSQASAPSQPPAGKASHGE